MKRKPRIRLVFGQWRCGVYCGGYYLSVAGESMVEAFAEWERQKGDIGIK